MRRNHISLPSKAHIMLTHRHFQLIEGEYFINDDEELVKCTRTCESLRAWYRRTDFINENYHLPERNVILFVILYQAVVADRGSINRRKKCQWRRRWELRNTWPPAQIVMIRCDKSIGQPFQCKQPSSLDVINCFLIFTPINESC